MKKKQLMVFLILVLGVEFALASTGAGKLPWESGLKDVVDSITGPVAFGISVIALVGVGAGLIFGGEISTFMKTAAYVVLVIAFIVSAVNIVQLFGGKGMLI